MEGMRTTLLRVVRHRVKEMYAPHKGKCTRGDFEYGTTLYLMDELEQGGPAAPATWDDWCAICDAANTAQRKERRDEVTANDEHFQRTGERRGWPYEFPAAGPSEAFVSVESYLYLYLSNECTLGQSYLRPCLRIV